MWGPSSDHTSLLVGEVDAKERVRVPLKAMEQENEDSKGLKAVSRKVDASQNVLLPESQQEKSNPIGVSLNPEEPFTLQYMAQKGTVMMIEKHAENWVEIAEQSLWNIRQLRGKADFGNFEQQIYEAVISHFAPILGTSEHFRGEYFLPSQLTSRVDTLFAETKDEESQRSMERAIEKHINTHICLWTHFKGFRDFWKDLCSFQGLGASVNFRDRFREALRKGDIFALDLSNKDLKDNSVFLNMFGSLDVRSLVCVDDEFLGEVAKHKNIKRLAINHIAPESMDLLGELSQAEELSLVTNNINDISPIAKMTNLHN